MSAKTKLYKVDDGALVHRKIRGETFQLNQIKTTSMTRPTTNSARELKPGDMCFRSVKLINSSDSKKNCLWYIKRLENQLDSLRKVSINILKSNCG
jgi:hypothetical protein